MNFLTKTVMIGLLLVSSVAPAIPTQFTGEYNYIGSASSNLLQPGDPHNLLLVDILYGQDVDPIVVDAITTDETILISDLSTNFNKTGQFFFDWSLTGTASWDIVGFGVKAGPINHYFELDPNVSVPAQGSFDLFDELTAEGFAASRIKEVSHVDVFGVESSPVTAFEPSTGLLAAFGLGGILAFRRKKQM